MLKLFFIRLKKDIINKIMHPPNEQESVSNLSLKELEHCSHSVNPEIKYFPMKIKSIITGKLAGSCHILKSFAQML